MLAARIHEDGGPEVIRVEEVPDPVAGPGRGARPPPGRVAQPPRRLGPQGAAVRAEAADPRRRRLRRGRGARRGGRRALRGAPGRPQPRARARRHDHGGRRASRRHARRADRDRGRAGLPARRRAVVRGRRGVPARLRDRLPHARHARRRAGGRVGADLGDRRRRRNRGVRDLPRARRADDRHVGRATTSWSGAVEWGADVGVNHDDGDVVAAVKEATGTGVDVVVETVGEATWARSLAAVRPAAVSSCAAPRAGRIRRRSSTGSGGSSSRCSARRWARGRTSSAHTSSCAAGRAARARRPRLPARRDPAAHERLEAGEQLGKIVLGIPG